MISAYLSNYMHPERVGTIVAAVEALSSYGFDSCGQTMEKEILSGSPQGVDGVISKVEEIIQVAIESALAQFGVSIDYRDELIDDHMAMLHFLYTWNTPEGHSAATIPVLGGHLRELGETEVDILLELYALADNVPERLYIDWVERVETYLINTLERQFEDEEAIETAVPASISDAVLNPFRAFAAQYPESAAVDYIRNGGKLGLDVDILIDQFDLAGHLDATLDEKRVAENLVGILLISGLERGLFDQVLSETVERHFGSTERARRTKVLCNQLLNKVG